MKKVWLALMAIALTSSPAIAEKKLMFVTEDKGVKIYIHPETIKKNKPNVRFWAYATAPVGNLNTSSDIYFAMDCEAEIFRVLQIIRYNKNGDAIINESLTLDEPPQFLKSLGKTTSNALIKLVCN